MLYEVALTERQKWYVEQRNRLLVRRGIVWKKVFIFVKIYAQNTCSMMHADNPVVML